MDSFVYLILSFMDSLAFTPVTCAEYADHFVAVREPDRQDAAIDHTKTIEPRLALAVLAVPGYYTIRMSESVLRF